MSDTHKWLERYERTHSDLAYPLVYWAAVPLVVLGTTGLLWLVPIPQEFFDISPLLNWGSAFLMAATVYYFINSRSLANGMLPFVIGIASFQLWLGNSQFSPLRVTLSLLIAGIIGLCLGHLGRGGLRAVIRDLQLMMIGPAWLLSVLYRRAGIPI